MKLVIITGLSGAGKSQAINVLEDLGYYCIDNMPPALMRNFAELSTIGNNNVDKAAFVIDVRGGHFFDDAITSVTEMKNYAAEKGDELKIIYLEADTKVLIRRFNETRRNHPLSAKSVKEGLEEEVQLLSGIRDISDYIIDTSSMKTSMLKSEIISIINGDKTDETFTINIQSFGYKHGIPLDADLVFDMRFIPNPFYVPSLKNLTGNNKKIQEFVMKHEISQQFVEQASTLIEQMIPGYIREGKYHLNIAFGCTGGHHRSVTMANLFHEKYKAEGRRVTCIHRDLS